MSVISAGIASGYRSVGDGASGLQQTYILPSGDILPSSSAVASSSSGSVVPSIRMRGEKEIGSQISGTRARASPSYSAVPGIRTPSRRRENALSSAISAARKSSEEPPEIRYSVFPR